ncbi:hypothetical protein [Pseudomonas delhiensis]|uniref:hypothetical protein n=1 Tax=Pseudomonas delhiensis TaxID=366289 RepID=UPI0011135216|nr:hypothetical protein [Pseudomonas delhiensis]
MMKHERSVPGPKVNFLIVLLVLVGISFFIYCLVLYQSPAERHDQLSIESQLKTLVLAQLSKPESAVFRNVRGACGEVRYTAFNGIEVGFKRFVMISEGHVIIEQADSEAPFGLIWQGTCGS